MQLLLKGLIFLLVGLFCIALPTITMLKVSAQEVDTLGEEVITSNLTSKTDFKVESFRGRIIDQREEELEFFGESVQVVTYTVSLNIQGEITEVEVVDQKRPELVDSEFNVGDKVIVDRAIINDTVTYVITDFQRTEALALLLFIFCALVVLVARKQGFFSLIGLVVSYLVIFQVLLAQILNGTNALFAAILSAIIIIPINYYLSHGLNAKASYAIISTIITLIIVGILALVFVDLAKLTGYTSDEAGFLNNITDGVVQMKDLVLAGIIIGTLGILDDITISQSSIANQLKAAKPNIRLSELIRRTIAVGKDHIASLVNTLILVYTSASLPLLLLFTNSQDDFLATINREVVAEEIVIMLLSSIGLILAVPISTLFSCYMIDKRGAADDSGHSHDHDHGHNHTH